MRDLGVGFGFLAKGQSWVFRHRRWWGIGMLPALITLVGYVAALIALVRYAGDIVAWATPFADGWGSPWLGAFRGVLEVLFFGGCLFLALITFTAVTLAVGGPCYEALSEQVDISEDGTAPEPGLTRWQEVVTSVRDGIAIVVRAAVWGVLLFALGFVPVIGQTAVPVLGVCVSGYFLTEELTSIALARRGIVLAERLRMLRAHKLLVLGFGVPLTLLFLVPLVAVFLMPGAVAGATLLARGLTGEADEDPAARGEAAADGASTGAAA
jgi:CysZ protein